MTVTIGKDGFRCFKCFRKRDWHCKKKLRDLLG